MEYTGGKLHIPTISTENSVELIREAKKKGLNVTCSASAEHISLTDKEITSFDSNYKIIPPLRSESDRKAIIKGIGDRTIDMITSDHNPIAIENKNLEFENSLYGTIGLESLFGSINKVIDLETAINCLTENPRKRFGLEQCKIEKGENANLSLFDPNCSYTFSEKDIFSKSKNSAFLDRQLKGIVFGIFANKQLVLNKQHL